GAAGQPEIMAPLQVAFGARLLQCDNAPASHRQTSPGPAVRRARPWPGALSPGAVPQGRAKGHPKVRSSKPERLIMEMRRTERSPGAAATAGQTQDLRGAEILVKCLQAENVKFVWGYPGGAVLHIYDAFYKQDTIQHVLVRHEQAAVHAADGYARATGDV